MHELYIAQCILDGVRRSLPADVDAGAVRTVTVRVGKLDAVVHDSLTFLFEAIKHNSGFDEAELLIEEEPVRLGCRCCGLEFSIDEPIFLCPGCGSADVATLSGRGITLQGITIAEPAEQ
jgi:hydrogenase nickel incorporation protein HypA/HybF